MAKSMYCPDCKRNITPEKKFNWLAFIFLAGVFYLPVYWLKKKKCPICGNKKLQPAKSDSEINDILTKTSAA